MEIDVGGKDVLLTTHKTYRVEDDVNAIQCLKEYAPFLQFIAACAERGPVPRAIILRNIIRIAHRIISVLADVEYMDSTGARETQPLLLVAAQPVILLPVATATDGVRYGILLQHRRLAYGMTMPREAFVGVEANSSVQLEANHASMLAEVGVNLNQAQPIGQPLYTVGNDGSLTYRVYKAEATLSDEQLQALVQGCSEGPLTAVPLSAILSTADAKACLAASLL